MTEGGRRVSIRVMGQEKYSTCHCRLSRWKGTPSLEVRKDKKVDSSPQLLSVEEDN